MIRPKISLSFSLLLFQCCCCFLNNKNNNNIFCWSFQVAVSYNNPVIIQQRKQSQLKQQQQQQLKLQQRFAQKQRPIYHYLQATNNENENENENNEPNNNIDKSNNNDENDKNMNPKNNAHYHILCVGETLYDSLPDAIFLGGAVTNVAVHLASLFGTTTTTKETTATTATTTTATVSVVSCVGKDPLGMDAIRRMSLRGVDTSYMQRHDTLGTGMVTASIDPITSDATYVFDTPAAWDAVTLTDDLGQALLLASEQEHQNKTILVIGTIASRLGGTAIVSSSTSKTDTTINNNNNNVNYNDDLTSSASTILALRNMAPEDTVVLDVNLRPPWYDPAFVLTLARGSRDNNNDDNNNPSSLAMIKLNEDELPIVEEWCGLTSTTTTTSSNKDDKDEDNTNSKMNSNNSLYGETLKQRMIALGRSVNARRVCVTRGKDGAALYCFPSNDDTTTTTTTTGIFVEHDGYNTNNCHYIRETKENGSDTVGAGDSFIATMIRSLLIEKESPEIALDRACALGGYVANRRGAVPDHSKAPEGLRQIFSF